MEMMIPRTDDFEVNGRGSALQWRKANWHDLAQVGNITSPHRTRVKTLYSPGGLYFLFDCQDKVLTCSMTSDLDRIFTEDVVEVFLWPDQEQNLYFEYELSPLDVELPILVPNCQGHAHGWAPWEYEGPRRTRHATSATGGPATSKAAVEGWMAEFFIPLALLEGMGNLQLAPGTRWRGNMYRIDYDQGPMAQWAWCPDTGPNFHNFRHFGTLMFE